MIGVIIQARMNSSRLRGKVLMPIGPKKLLEHIFYRLTFLRNKVKVVVATSINSENDEIQSLCESLGVDVYRGSEQNVLERYFLCAKQYGFSSIVRLTADNPLVDIEQLDALIDTFLGDAYDYGHSFDSLPKGVGAEIFTFDALKASYEKGQQPHHIEHVNEYMLENPNAFNTVLLETPDKINRPDVSLTVDTKEDYDKMCKIFDGLKKDYIKTEDALQFLQNEGL